MKYLKDSDPRFRMLGWRAGSFALLALGLMLALVVALGLRQGYFVQKTRLNFVAENGAGLLPGMQVRLSGFKIGVVDTVALGESAKVDVELLVETRYMKWVKADSQAILQQDGFLGDHFIEIVGGSPKLPPAQDGAKLNFAPALGLADIALDLRQRIIPIIDSTQTTLEYINDPKGDVRQMLGNLKELSAEVRQTRAAVDALLAKADRVADKQVPATLEAAQRTLERADRTLADVQGRLPGVFDQLDRTMGHAAQAASEAAAVMGATRHIVDEAAPRVPGILRNGDATLRTTRELLDGASQSWPLKNWMQPPAASAPMPDSRQ
ncbi:phospholipid/cholesterol/gamma-HCH transport system substrate-binding protein [Andreprevotia lacus DSM 23236]|jgi:phospholipid/cholesterol/gamma-HCH transport system substrate-binding protein|uniref:Phospholipid/cholesterol/gamma-HCH transport system substrate-binding protein n=1 Tax=Andreprevotia lacus DSM 23236 TaxID=1121001 RepID=A0A1W1XL97_9NEIS|nr:MlaD family protein [Andreprevotia lacus]SMC24740.1 phospholipid/cholesterol/gamma-HCH transport system substrate-binding protein [Andreprevotia lacus DSM 23236]